MYVYITSEPGLYTVGFYKPDGTFKPESDHTTAGEAAKRVHYLNGGNEEAADDECSRKECTYFSHYLVHHDPEVNGPRLDHEPYHCAEKRCEEAQKSVTAWYDAHENDGRRTHALEDLERRAEAWERKICA